MYRIVQMGEDATTRPTDIAEFDSAYAAVDAMRDAIHRSREGASRWRVLDAAGRILAEPLDLVD